MIEIVKAPASLCDKLLSLEQSTFQSFSSFQPDKGPPTRRARESALPARRGIINVTQAEHDLLRSCQANNDLILLSDRNGADHWCSMTKQTKLQSATYSSNPVSAVYTWAIEIAMRPAPNSVQN